MKKLLQMSMVCLLLFASVLSFSSCTAGDAAKEKISNGWSAVKGFFQEVFTVEAWNTFKDAFSEKQEAPAQEAATDDPEQELEAAPEQTVEENIVSLSSYRVSLCSAEETISLTAAETTSTSTSGYDVYFNMGDAFSPEIAFEKEQYNDYREYIIPLNSTVISFLHCCFLYDEEVTGYRLYSLDDELLTSGDHTTSTYADIMLYPGMTYKLQILGLHGDYVKTFLNNQRFDFYSFSANNQLSVTNYFNKVIESVWYNEELEKALQGARDQAVSDNAMEITNIHNKTESLVDEKEELETNIDTLNEAIRKYHEFNKSAEEAIAELEVTLKSLKAEESAVTAQLVIAQKELEAWNSYCIDIRNAFKEKYADYLTQAEIDGIVSGRLVGVLRNEEE